METSVQTVQTNSNLNSPIETNEYIQNTLGEMPKIAIEASISFGWEKWLSKNDIFIGMKSFGASAPANELYKFFNITKEEIIKKSKTLLK